VAEESEVIEKTIKKSSVGRWLWTVSTMLTLPVLAWLGNEALDTAQEFSKTIETLNDRILVLESNKSNNEAIWNAIAEANHKVTDMRVSHEAGKRHIDWLSDNWLLIQTIKPSPDQQPAIPPLPKPVPVAPAPAPKVDPKDFRAQYEQRFPNQQQKK
jgi:hypothetical protein